MARPDPTDRHRVEALALTIGHLDEVEAEGPADDRAAYCHDGRVKRCAEGEQKNAGATTKHVNSMVSEMVLECVHAKPPHLQWCAAGPA
jgi:hypothetical protein